MPVSPILTRLSETFKRHPWISFLLWATPLGLLGGASAILGGKPIPQWLAENGWPPLRYLLFIYYLLALLGTGLFVWKSKSPNHELVEAVRGIYTHRTPAEKRMLRSMTPLMRAPNNLNVGQITALQEMQTNTVIRTGSSHRTVLYQCGLPRSFEDRLG